MKNIFIATLSISFLAAQKNVVFFNYNTLQHKGNVHQSHSINSELKDRISFFDGDLDLRAGVTTHFNLGNIKENNNSSIINDNRAMINSLALDYYINNHTLISLGRQAMELNLLSGSFDGVLLAGSYHNLEVKTFYFNHYTTLQPTYYEHYSLENLFGINTIYNNDNFDSEITLFGNKENKVSNIYISYSMFSTMLGVEYLRFDSSSSLLEDEASYKLFLAYKYDSFLIESGIYNVYKGSLKHVYGLGSSQFKAFPLSSFLDQKNAKNIYINLEYHYDYFYTKIHIGKTIFDKDNIAYEGKELGMTFGLRYKQYEFYSEFLTQQSNQLFGHGKRTTWLQVNLKYRF